MEDCANWNYFLPKSPKISPKSHAAFFVTFDYFLITFEYYNKMDLGNFLGNFVFFFQNISPSPTLSPKESGHTHAD